MDTITGLPAHPFLAHIPVILLPLAVLGIVLMVIKPAWHQRYRWAVLAVTAVGAIGTVFVAEAGEKLEDRIVAIEGAAARAGWEDHAEAGDTARLFAMLFLVVVLAYILVPFFLERRAKAAGKAVGADTMTAPATGPKWLRPVLSALVLLAAAGSLVTVIQAGHSGSKSVWKEVVDQSNEKINGGTPADGDNDGG